MFKIKFFEGKKKVGEFEFKTFEEAEDASIDNEMMSTSYKIYDPDGELLEEDEYETVESITKTMFPEGDEDEFDHEDFFD